MANPLVKLEVMRRFRGQAAAWAIPLLVLLPGAAVTIVYASATSSSPMIAVDEFGNPMEQAGIAAGELQSIGVSMFVAVLVTLLIALLLMVPSTVGGSIAGERHSQTLQPLQLTAMTPTQIVWGKLASSVAFLLVLLACAAPVVAIPYLLGGITTAQLIGAYVVLVLIAIEYAAISLAVSALMSRPAPAIMVSLGICAFLTVAPWVATAMAYMVSSRQVGFEPEESAARYLAVPSPVSLGSWVPVEDDLGDWVRGGHRFGSLLVFAAVVAGSLWFARRKVIAPVEQDR